MPLNISELRYVLFDWDNTLAESRTALVYTVNQVLKEYHLPPWEDVKKKRDDTLSFRDNFSNIFGPAAAEEAYRRYAGLYLQNVGSLIKTFPGVRKVLAYFRKRGILMIILTNKDRRLLEYELPLLFDRGLFANIVCGHEAPRDKPFPEQAYYALGPWLRPQEINRENVWIIGDSTMDSDCALAAGALPVRIGRPIWHGLETPQPDILYFKDFNAFLAALPH